jgi:hypothetical protein
MSKLLASIVLMLLLVGCGSSPDANVGAPASPSAAPAAPSAPPLEATPMPTSDPADPAAAMAALARQQLAQQLGVPVDEIAIQRVDPVEWSDGSLGCPQPGSFYPQVITPGYRVTLEHGGTSYSYHTDASRVALPCAAGQQSQ